MCEFEELDGHVETGEPNRGKTTADKAKKHGGPTGRRGDVAAYAGPGVVQ